MSILKRLYIIEGLPCSGKSTASGFVAEKLEEKYNVCYFDEGSGNHPSDYEFHAFITDFDLHNFSEAEQNKIRKVCESCENGYIIPLSLFEGDLCDRLLKYKIYDFLPWETEYPVMLEKWRSFAENSDADTVYVFNCVLLQNPMCETMMRFGFPKEKSLEYISEITKIIKQLNPVVIYLKNDNISTSVIKTSAEREGWLEAVIGYHNNGAFGKSINAQGFDGYIACLEERQKRELEILSELDIESLVIDNPQRDWDKAYTEINDFL